MSDLSSQTVLITGAGTGIGRCAALQFGAAGATVVLAGRRQAPLDSVASEIEAAGGEAWAQSTDMEDPASVKALAQACLERHGVVHTVVHNAGHSSKVRSVRYIDEDEWNSVLAVNVTGPMVLTRELLPAMLEDGGGTVILVSSMAALRPGPMAGTAYGAAKAAAKNYMSGLAAELRQQGVRATTILPGEVDTPILDNRPLVPSAEQRAGMMMPEDVADAIFLAASLPHRTMIEDLTIMPTRLRDMSADVAAAKKLGAPE